MFSFADRISPSVDTAHKTGVFWDVDDLPFPADFTAQRIYCKIAASVWKKGYGRGPIKVFAYAAETAISDDMVFSCSELGVYFIGPSVPKDKCERLQMMMHDIEFWVLDAVMNIFSTDDIYLIVIANDIEGKINLKKCIDYQVKRNLHTFLFQPAFDIPSEKPQSSVWQGGGPCLFDGGFSSKLDVNSLKRKRSDDSECQD